MSLATAPAPATWLATGTVLLIFGYLIRFQGWTFLVAGYDEDAGVPDHVVAAVVGNMVLRVGGGALGVGVLAGAGVVSPNTLGGPFALFVAIDVAQAIVRLNA